MTVTEFANYESFESELFAKLKKESNKALKLIDENEKLIKYNLNSKKFVNEFNNIILDNNNKIKNFKIFEAVLNHRLFTDVLAQFRESDVLVRACRSVVKHYTYVYDKNSYEEYYNKDLIKWLLTMNINYGIQDELGRTALMYAVKYESLDFAVKEMIPGKHINLLDKDGNSVLFFASEAYFTLDKFAKYKDLFDNNHVNNNNENLILYAARNRKMNCNEYIKSLRKFDCTEPNLMNNNGMTAAMYLVYYGQYEQLEYFLKENKGKINVNEVNNFGNSLVNVLIKKYYEFYSERIEEKKRIWYKSCPLQKICTLLQSFSWKRL